MWCCSFNSSDIVTSRTYIYQSWIFSVQSFPSALLPVHVWSQSCRSTVAFVPSLSFLSGGSLDPRLSLCSFLSISTTWSLGPSFPRAAKVSFGSITTRCPGGAWDTCHVCPHPGLSTIITRWRRLNRLQKNRKLNDKMLLVLDNFVCNLAFQSRWGSAYWFSLIASVYFGCLRFSFLGLRFLIFECILSIS